MSSTTPVQVNREGLSLTSANSTKMASSKVQRKQIVLSQAAQHLQDLEAKYAAGGFTPLPGFMDRGKGAKLWVRHLRFPLSKTCRG
jgi:hypothetical protein